MIIAIIKNKAGIENSEIAILLFLLRTISMLIIRITAYSRKYRTFLFFTRISSYAYFTFIFHIRFGGAGTDD